MNDLRYAFRELRILAVLCLQAAAAAHSVTYDVGPDQPLATPSHVPWESLNAGDHVRIYWRAEPYQDKWVICRQGSKESPIVIEGVPGPKGQLPVIDGKNATTRKKLNYWGEQRSLIKIGGANRPKDATPKHIWIKNLELRNSRPPFTYTGRKGVAHYENQSAGIFIEKGEHIRISNCTIRDNGNGIQASWFSKYLFVEHCHILENGIEKNGLAHNCYVGGIGVKFEFNRFGPLRKDCLGVNFKSRGAQTILRYNWIEGGKRCVNIVETNHKPVFDAPNYHQTFVYGNVIIRDDRAINNQVVHYGGDLPGRPKSWYRNGPLYFYNNTVIANRTRSTALFAVTSPDGHVDCRNNIVYTPPGGGPVGLLANGGKIKLINNWISKDGRNTLGRPTEFLAKSGNIIGVDPDFQNFDQNDFRLSSGSPCVNAAGPLAEAVIPIHAIPSQYRLHQRGEARTDADSLKQPSDLGAFGTPINSKPTRQ